MLIEVYHIFNILAIFIEQLKEKGIAHSILSSVLSDEVAIDARVIDNRYEGPPYHSWVRVVQDEIIL
jgi:hypothetical protein